MGERHEMALAKERRLETAEQPILSKAAKRKIEEEKKAQARMEKKENEKAARKQKASKKKKRKIEVNEDDLKNVEALAEDDEVQEGIDWSDSD